MDIHTKKLKKVLIFEKNFKDVPPTTSAFFLGLGYDTVTLEFWVPLEKAQVFDDGCKEMVFILTKNCERKIPTSKVHLLHKLRVLRHLEKVR